ncbi:hypothetical protein, partial [Nocardioides sp. CFH 31398]|uniref:hypothetical protein n=1 Tax=Nocardioides sp. CFH 31398 TaxID=2919579 RepID=UPI001F06E215
WGAGMVAPHPPPPPARAAVVPPGAPPDGIVPPQWRNGWLSNSGMALCALLFAGLMINEIQKQVVTNWPF